MTTSASTESVDEYSSIELEEMKSTFDKFDSDDSGHLDAHELTSVLQSMNYKYNELFVMGVLEIVFESEWETKRSLLQFEDFIDFRTEFDPLHNQMIGKMEQKLVQKQIDWINVDDPQITDLLKYIQMKNGSISFHEVDVHLDEMKRTKSKNTEPDEPKVTASEQKEDIAEHNETESISEKVDPPTTGTIDLTATDALDLLRSKPQRLEFKVMSNEEISEWLDTDKAFQTTKIRKECIDIVGQRQWNGQDLISNLFLDQIDDIMVQFGCFENYQYFVQSLVAAKPLDVDCNELKRHWEVIQKQNESNTEMVDPEDATNMILNEDHESKEHDQSTNIMDSQENRLRSPAVKRPMNCDPPPPMSPLNQGPPLANQFGDISSVHFCDRFCFLPLLHIH